VRQAITTEFLRRLQQHPPQAVTDVWDRTSRLVLRARPSGRHTYLVLLGRGRWYTLGGVHALTPAEARLQAQRRLGEVASGGDPFREKRGKQGQRFSDYLRQTYSPWLEANRKSGVAIAAHISATFGETIGHLKLSEVTGWHVERWRTARLKEGVTPATTNRDLSALRALFNRAVDWDHLSLNPLDKVKALPEDKIGRLRFLSVDEEARLRAALAARDADRQEGRSRANQWREARGYPQWPPLDKYTDNLTPIVLVALNTGLRFGELTALTWKDVNDAHALLSVTSQHAKSGRGRHVPLNSEAHDLLRIWKPVKALGGDYVFPGAEGTRLVDIKTAWMAILGLAGIDRFRFHDLRHTFASRLAMASVDLNTIRQLLGHSDIKMTLRYSHLAPEHTAAAVQKLVKGA
jgi:integrase